MAEEGGCLEEEVEGGEEEGEGEEGGEGGRLKVSFLTRRKQDAIKSHTGPNNILY